MSQASIIVCVFNREEAIARCLESLEAQTLPQLEVVVVDDGSTDGTASRLVELKARLDRIDLVIVTNPKNVGISASRNRGIAAASADLILFVDSDCIAAPGWVAAHATAFENPEVVATGGRVVDHPTTLAERAFAGTARTGVSKTQGRVLAGGNMAFRRHILEDYGFDPALTYGCDEDDLEWRLRSDGLALRHRPDALVHHHHGLDLSGYLRIAWLQGGGSARHWYKRDQYLGRDVVLWFVAAVALVASVAAPQLLLLTIGLVVVQIGALLFAEITYKGKGVREALAVLPLVVLHNLTKSISVALTLTKIAFGGERAVRRSKRAWKHRGQGPALKSAPHEDS